MDEILFEKFIKLIYSKSGILLKKGKEALLVARIQQRMRVLNIQSYEHYLDFVLNEAIPDESIKFIDVISTNVTSFFRETNHFDFLHRHLPEIARLNPPEIKIWSAACSTGEEPYSLSMVVQEALKGTNIKCRILATDISTRVLEQAKRGLYDPESVTKIPLDYRYKYVEPNMIFKNGLWQVKEEVKNRVTFARLNLSTPPFPMTGPFDFIFCRNVMIYFDQPVRNRLVKELFRLLRPNGYLIIGHAEILAHGSSEFQTLKSSIYRKSG